MQFVYTARDAQGQPVGGKLKAASRYAALAELQADQLTVVELRALEGGGTRRGVRQGAGKRKIGTGGRVALQDRAIFCRQLAISISAGIPLRDALESIAEDQENPRLAMVLSEVIAQLHKGRTFSQSLEVQEAVFGRLFVVLMRAAEESGRMPDTLDYLSTVLERADRLARRIRSIVAYPVFVAVFAVIVCLVMTVFVLPQFQEAFESFGGQLPLLTRVVFRFNQLMIANAPLILAGAIGLIALVVLYVRTPTGAMAMDRLKLRLPFFGTCLRQLAVARFSRNLAVLLKAGVPVIRSIEATAGVCGNRALEQALLAARERIIRGSDISSSLAAEPLVPRLVIRMVSVGESSGRLPEVLEKVSDAYEDQVEAAIMTATSLFEPIVICVFGAVILVLVLSIYVPIFTISSAVH